MSGMEMLLKSFGFDPEEIKTQVQTFTTKASETVNHFDARLKTIEARLASIESKLEGQSNGVCISDTRTDRAA